MGYKIITMKRQLLLYLIKLFMGIVIIIICWLALTNIFVECGVIIPANYSETILEENRKRLDDIQQITDNDLPYGSKYSIFDLDYNYERGTMNKSDIEVTKKILLGKESNLQGNYVYSVIARTEEYCVIKYNIKARFNSDNKIFNYIDYDNLSYITMVQGEKVALVGPNGSGKSTFLKILAGLYNIEEGEILINGRSLKDLDIRSYRSKMSVLFQDFVKYELSLRENIGFGDIQNLNNDEKMVQMLHKLQTKFLQTDNGSYNLDLQLGNWFEDGCQLSQGQWQKIALGRVYFRDASFYILDEPNAALDTVSEREVFEKFFELSKDKIGVFISHRLNAAKMADKIIVMDKGKIVGIGKHDELLRNCMTYQKLYKAESYEREDM